MKKIDLLIILLCLAFSVISGTAFWREYAKTYSKLNEAPVGTIIFKKRTAQRKIIDRASWDILKQKSDIYNADTIRTIKASEAVIAFNNKKTQITMNENTIIQVFYNDKEGARIDFFGGNLDVNSTEAGILIISDSSEVFIAGQANINKKDEGFSISVLEGEAVLNGEKIKAGEMLIFDEDGERNEMPAIMVTSLSAQARITAASEGATPVYFEWNAFNFNPDTFVIIETAHDPFFKSIAQAIDVESGASANLYIENPHEGSEYFWRAYPARAGSREPANTMYPSGILEIMPYIEHSQAVAVQTPARTATPTAQRALTPAEEVRQYYDRGWNSYIQGDFNAAIAEFNEGMRIYPNDAEGYANLGSAYRERAIANNNNADDFERAMENYNRAIQINPNFEPGYSGRASLYLRLSWVTGNSAYLDRVIEDVNRGIQLNPNTYNHTTRGQAYIDKGEYDLAILDFTEGMRLDPLYGETYIGLGNSYSKKGDHNRAIAEITQAIRIAPNTAYYYIHLGNAYKESGNLDRAIEEYEKGLQLKPNDTWGQECLASALAQKN